MLFLLRWCSLGAFLERLWQRLSLAKARWKVRIHIAQILVSPCEAGLFFRPFCRMSILFAACHLVAKNNCICHKVCFMAGQLTDKKKSPTGRERGSGFQESEKQ